MGARHIVGSAEGWDLDDLPLGVHPDALRQDPRVGRIAKHFRGIMVALGLDLDDPNLVGTARASGSSAATRSRSSLGRAARSRLAPAPASARAVAAPMPRLAPVTSARRPRSGLRVEG